MKTAQLLYSIICDDVRIEMGNKLSLMGLFEKPPDAFLLHKPADEVVIGLAVLDAIFSGRIGPLQVQPNTVGRNPALRQYVANDFADRQFLKNPRAVALREQPHRGHQFGPEKGLVDGFSGHLEMRDDAMKSTFARRAVDRELGGLTHDILEHEAGVARDQLDFEAVELA